MTSTPLPRRHPAWSAAPGVLRTAALMIACFLSVTLSVAYLDARLQGVTRPGPTPTARGEALLAFLAGTAAVIALLWRRRHPLPVAAAAVLVPALAWLDGLLPLVGIYVLLVHRRRRDVATWVGVALAAGAVLLSVHRDVQGVAEVSSLWRTVLPRDGDYPWWLVLLITAVLVTLALAIALLVATRSSAQESHRVADRAEERVGTLAAEVARQAERERIAREVHDVIGHRLSLLSLHAGALEVAAGDDTKMARSAALIRESAQESMTDLRSLLDVLRHPDAPDVAAPVLTLRDLPGLVEETLATGTPLMSSIYVDESAELDERVSHTAYRVTQELLTNARRHAPGEGVRLRVQGRPATGIEIAASNRLPDQSTTAVTPGNGLTGVHERVSQCGGQCWLWVEDGALHLVARLPWGWQSGLPEHAAPSRHEELA